MVSLVISPNIRHPPVSIHQSADEMALDRWTNEGGALGGATFYTRTGTRVGPRSDVTAAANFGRFDV
jgi:hypothetical protein